MEVNNVLRKYIYSNYYHLLRDKEFQQVIGREGWSSPAFVPYNMKLRGNNLIRKYLTLGVEKLIRDIQFGRIMCEVGFTGPFCTTSTSTTTTTTSP